jgi:hypothetical protein
MEVNKQLRKQIIIEICALGILIFAIMYGVFAIGKDSSTVFSQDGMIIVYDNEAFKAIQSVSDGEGLNSDGIKYTVTNNNSDVKKYKLILKVNEDDDLLEYIRVGIDDLYVENLIDLEKYKGGYVLFNYELDPGYTKIHSIKMWYKLDVDHEIALGEIDYDIELINE